jgi:regulator of replication initiation timing
MTEIERLKKELADAKAENDRLRLRLDNVTLLYRQELLAASKLPKAAKEKSEPISN